MVLRSIEERLERLVEGMFARAFKTGLQPVEVGRRLIRTLDGNRTLDVRAQLIGPNHYVVHLASQDFMRFSQIHESLLTELRDSVRSHARNEAVAFPGRVVVELVEDAHLTVGIFRIKHSFDSTGPAQSSAFIELDEGERIELGHEVITIGRLPSSHVVLTDPNASRNHAELHPSGDSYEVVDLGSTNGVRVNGERVNRLLLVDGDVIKLGVVSLVFRLA